MIDGLLNLEAEITNSSVIEYIGFRGTGTFTQEGGLHHIAGPRFTTQLRLGFFSTGVGTYNLLGGELRVFNTDSSPTFKNAHEIVGLRGSGSFLHTGGLNFMEGSLTLGSESGSDGVYELGGDGELSVNTLLVIGNSGGGVFRQTDATSTAIIGDTVLIGSSVPGNGMLEMDGGTLTIGQFLTVGNSGTGEIVQNGGVIDVADLFSIGNNPGSMGTVNLGGTGALTSDRIFLGRHGAGSVSQSGGTLNTNSLFTGLFDGSSGSYSISGGTMNVGRLFIGGNLGDAEFHITNAAAQINVSETLSFGDGAIFDAVPGSTIHMTGSGFFNLSTVEAELAGLNNLTMIFEGGEFVFDSFEVAGLDLGLVDEGFNLNFALDSLVLGGTDEAHLVLVNDYDNGNHGGVGGFEEALYVDTLTIGAGSTLELNNYHLYVRNLNNQGTITGGHVTMSPVPEPGTIALLGIGLFGLARRVRFKKAV